MRRFAKLWAALSAGAGVVLAAELLPVHQATVIATAIGAGSAAIAVLVGPANRP